LLNALNVAAIIRALWGVSQIALSYVAIFRGLLTVDFFFVLAKLSYCCIAQLPSLSVDRWLFDVDCSFMSDEV